MLSVIGILEYKIKRNLVASTRRTLVTIIDDERDDSER